MKVTPIKTERILAGKIDIFTVLDSAIRSISEKNVLVVTSKIMSLCENRVVPIGSIDKERLVIEESDYYLPSSLSKYGYYFAIAMQTLAVMAGIDESNGNNNYVLWPSNPQKSANRIRDYLVKRFSLSEIGVIVTDSTCQPLRLGTTGVSIAHSGFNALTDYIGSPDLFGRPFDVTCANLANGLAATAVVAMGEGAEQTPICILEDLNFIKFQLRNPTRSELEKLKIPLEDDLYEPFLNAVQWKRGKRVENG